MIEHQTLHATNALFALCKNTIFLEVYLSIFLQYANAVIFRFNSFPYFLPYMKMERNISSIVSVVVERKEDDFKT